jgi:GrpB-like predicted nucleotidyltransferase (UPF0157 family)
MVLGLKHNTNILVDYDPEWPAEFAHERDRIAGAIGHIAKGIEHYGSTSVPGLRAKPILDIIVALDPLSDWEACHDPLLALGYDYAAHVNLPGHRIFGRGRDLTERTHLVHLVELGGYSWVSNLALRDALRNDPDLRQEYTALKEQAVTDAPDSRARYNQLKSHFIETVKARLLR